MNAELSECCHRCTAADIDGFCGQALQETFAAAGYHTTLVHRDLGKWPQPRLGITSNCFNDDLSFVSFADHLTSELYLAVHHRKSIELLKTLRVRACLSARTSLKSIPCMN